MMYKPKERSSAPATRPSDLPAGRLPEDHVGPF